MGVHGLGVTREVSRGVCFGESGVFGAEFREFEHADSLGYALGRESGLWFLVPAFFNSIPNTVVLLVQRGRGGSEVNRWTNGIYNIRLAIIRHYVYCEGLILHYGHRNQSNLQT